MNLKPDYEYKGKCHIRFFNCDNMEFMKEVENKQYAIGLVDPPYGASDAINPISSDNVKLAKRKKYKEFKNIAPTQEYFSELKRVSKNTIIWGGNYFGLIGGVIAWNKNGTAFGEGEIAICSTHNSVRFFEYTWNGMLQQDMKNKEERIHPTQKPIALYRWLLQNYAKQGDKILDTHGGSMTLARACYEEGFDLDIMELDKEYFDKGVLAFKQHVSQYNLFQ